MVALEEGIKTVISKCKAILFWAAAHALLAWVVLVIAYNSYKEYMRGPNGLYIFPDELRTAIKSTFPSAVLIFVVLYILHSIISRKTGGYSTVKKYAVIIPLYAILANLLFLQSGIDILIVLNLSIICLIMALLVFGGIKYLGAAAACSKALAVVIEPLKRYVLRVLEYATSKNSEPFVLGFIILLGMCALLLMFKQEKIGEELANIAYVLLVIGVVKEVCRMIRYGEKDEQG